MLTLSSLRFQVTTSKTSQLQPTRCFLDQRTEHHNHLRLTLPTSTTSMTAPHSSSFPSNERRRSPAVVPNVPMHSFRVRMLPILPMQSRISERCVHFVRVCVFPSAQFVSSVVADTYLYELLASSTALGCSLCPYQLRITFASYGVHDGRNKHVRFRKHRALIEDTEVWITAEVRNFIVNYAHEINKLFSKKRNLNCNVLRSSNLLENSCQASTNR